MRTPERKCDEGNDMIKSPSDTTIYALGLMKNNPRDAVNVIDKISDFVESIRFEEGRKQRSRSNTPSTKTDRQTHENKESENGYRSRRRREEDDARERANDLILQAEKFKGNVVAPQGMENISSILLSKFQNETELRQFFDNDDDFFPCYLSCRTSTQK